MTTPHNGEQLSKHSAEFQKKAFELGHDAKDIGKIGGQIATDTAHIAKERITEYYKDGVKIAKNLEENVETEVRKNPVGSLMIAAGVGLLLGAFWRRR